MGFISKCKNTYLQFTEKQGFPVIVTVCVAVITFSAIWTKKQEEPWIAPTPPPANHISAAGLIQQSLRQALTAEPTSRPSPPPWHAPLDEIIILQDYSTNELIYFEGVGLYQLHDAVDLQASPGTPVRSIAEGTVIDAGKDALYGSWITIQHTDDITVTFSGLELIASYLPGDRVYPGDTLAFTGIGMPLESHLPPHLHMRVTQDGVAIDPLTLWEDTSQQ